MDHVGRRGGRIRSVTQGYPEFERHGVMNFIVSACKRIFAVRYYCIKTPLPPPPTTCCMSGCQNCVWIKYAQEILTIYKDTDRVSKQVLDSITDPSLRAFLQIELKLKLKNDSD